MDQATALARRLVALDDTVPFAPYVLIVDDLKQGRFAAADTRLDDLSTSGFNAFMVPLLGAWAEVGLGQDGRGAGRPRSPGRKEGIPIHAPSPCWPGQRHRGPRRGGRGGLPRRLRGRQGPVDPPRRTARQPVRAHGAARGGGGPLRGVPERATELAIADGGAGATRVWRGAGSARRDGGGRRRRSLVRRRQLAAPADGARHRPPLRAPGPLPQARLSAGPDHGRRHPGNGQPPRRVERRLPRHKTWVPLRLDGAPARRLQPRPAGPNRRGHRAARRHGRGAPRPSGTLHQSGRHPARPRPLRRSGEGLRRGGRAHRRAGAPALVLALYPRHRPREVQAVAARRGRFPGRPRVRTRTALRAQLPRLFLGRPGNPPGIAPRR